MATGLFHNIISGTAWVRAIVNNNNFNYANNLVHEAVRALQEQNVRGGAARFEIYLHECRGPAAIPHNEGSEGYRQKTFG